ncbi:protein of unknown function DUF1007 [Thioalkalivibrio sulfidiphilus HL-EbGr7]|uniref:DUF1007 family protein n=1 Tax=Thioalkalivibrio sulfidiphilus (strain HL-EbGR7) TaxID=396588 RepID=B8GPC6_THISH|nr:DUF1007 family protein [Thioalkalivibrio sulfidiphilus]ACL74046.1 protein of unknown function DUF1007 [Thioalkalivibrio sulfidiphilus HL-EbGr7]
MQPFALQPLRRLLTGLVLFLTVLLSAQAHAHPHAWIDLRVAVVFDETGRITALRQVWRIDPFYSLVLLEEMATDARGNTPEEKLADIGNRMIENLTPYQYFTEVSHGGQRLQGFTVRDHGLVNAAGRLELGFTLVLPEPVNPETGPLSYAVFDPSYYIEILHDPDATVALEGASERCGLQIRQPRPDPVIVARAAALDANQTGDPDLGRHFTEHGEVRCDPAP